MKISLHALPLIIGLVSPCNALAASPTSPAIPIPESGGYEVPIYGTDQRIWDVYMAADGNLIFDVGFKDHGVYKTDFYNSKAKRRMFPDQERELAKSNELERRLLPKGLIKLRGELFETKGPHGQSVKPDCVCGAKIELLYSERIVLNSAKAGTAEVSLFQKHNAKQTWYRPENGDHSAKTHYQVLTAHIYDVEDGGFFILAGHLFIHFQWDGQAKFLSKRSDIIAVPYGELGKIMDFENSFDKKQDQKRYSKADAYISTIAANQHAGVLTDFKVEHRSR